MENDSFQTLRVLLFGDESDDRRPAPDFQVLTDLAPLLDGVMLARVVEELASMGMATRRQLRTIVALLPSLPGPRRDEMLARAVLQHESVAQFLTTDEVHRALAGLRVVEPDLSYRANQVLALARLLPPVSRQAVILEESLAAARLPEIGRSEQRAICTLVAGLDQPLPAEGGTELYQIVDQWEADGGRLEVLGVLAPLLPESLRAEATSQVLEEVRGETDPVERAENMLRVAVRTTGAQQAMLVNEAYAAAREIDLQNRQRLALLAHISLYISETIRVEVLSEALRPYHEEVFKWPSGEEALVRTLGELAPALPPDRLEVLRTELQKLPLPDNFPDLIPLVPYLSEPQYAAALEKFSDPYWDEVIADAFTLLALHLPPDLLPAAFSKLASWENEKFKNQTLAELIPGLPAGLLPQAIALAGSFKSEQWRARAAEALRGRADWTDHSHPIFALAQIGDQIRSLWPALPGDRQQDLIAEVMGRLWEDYGGMEAANGGAGEEADPKPENGGDTGVIYHLYPYKGDEDGVGGSGRDTSSGGKSIDYEEPSDNGGGEIEDPGVGSPPPAIDDEEAAGDDEQDNGGEAAEDEKLPVVNTGFAAEDSPDEELSREFPLQQEQNYYFWFHIGRQKKTAIAAESPEIDVTQLPPEAELTVALFGFEGELEITPSADIGVVKILPSRRMAVVAPAAEPAHLDDPGKLKGQLYFPVRTPACAGDFRLRCNIYYEGVLLQSHLVTARVVPAGEPIDLTGLEGPPLRHALDYTLTNSLQTEMFSALEKHSLSLLINDNGDGTHGFRFFGGENGQVVKEDATFTALELQDMIEQARGALRKASWDTKDEWTSANPYRYKTERPPDWIDRLQGDLVLFAKWGARFFRLALQKLAESGAADLDEADRRKELLAAAVRQPGRLQIAAKDTSRHVLPAALIYDHLFHDALPAAAYRLCPVIRAALENDASMVDTICFQDECPHWDELHTVCPSGFWGYRHVLGFPVSIGPEAPDLELKISFTDAPQVSTLVSLDDDFKLRDGHIDRVRGLRPGLGWKYGDQGQEILDLLRQERSHLVYFYCHGGLSDDGVPYLQVGPDGDWHGIITPTVLPNTQIKWAAPKPLVFINGCHTTALEPAKSLDLVTSFVKEARAVGVVGTEITIFEPLATAFAEECLAHFLNEVPIGDAIRRARLKLLQDGNPLGLVYIPFVVSSVRLVKDERG